ncbi:MAG: hypothetical protein DMG96_33805 [Acidobacteria bacterium]|nr:MAG: hypothetical protein DMG96_33805 [Acidobacteriota bacterium]
MRRELVTAARVAQGISARSRQKIDCPSLGKRLFWPPYRLLNADEFSSFRADIRSNQENAVHM